MHSLKGGCISEMIRYLFGTRFGTVWDPGPKNSFIASAFAIEIQLAGAFANALFSKCGTVIQNLTD